MCEFAVKEETWLFVFIPDWFVTAGMHEKCKDDKQLEECLRSYKHCKVQKAMIKEELLTIALHSDRARDFSFSENKKKVLEYLYE